MEVLKSKQGWIPGLLYVCDSAYLYLVYSILQDLQLTFIVITTHERAFVKTNQMLWFGL